MKKIKVLVSAYACEPDKGSEPGVGWNWAKQIAKFAETWVITRANNRPFIEAALSRSPDANLHFVYWDVPRWLGFWKRKTRGLYLYYFLWQIGAYLLARRLVLRERLDLVHHLTFGNIWLPTFMPFLSIPFIWGPIGGGEQVPRAFTKDYSFKARMIENARDVILWLLKVNPFFLLTCRKASLIIARTNETLSRIPPSFRSKTVKMMETGVEENMQCSTARIIRKDDVQIVTVGRLIHLKGVDLALKAFSKALKQKVKAKLVIIGDGPERKRLENICREQELAGNVCFTGQISHDEVFEYLSGSSIFLFPSLKEGGPWVLFEAMSLGLPIICLDIAGPSEIVNEECGVKIRPETPEQTINDLANAILTLTGNPDLMRRMGEKGRERIKNYFSWEKKGDFIKKLYEEILK